MMLVKAKVGVELTFSQEICHKEMQRNHSFQEDLEIVDILEADTLATTTVTSVPVVTL
jgi:hypothetical protein